MSLAFVAQPDSRTQIYPKQYVRRVLLSDGTQVLLRPIRAADEPLWRDLLARCSEHSIWSRFHYLFKETTHEMAAHFCDIDYDRTLAIVAEISEHGAARLIGVARLVANANHLNAEYAVLIEDAWQGRGLGSRLTKYCLEIGRTWHIDEVVAETTADNCRMQRILSKEGFILERIAANELLYRKTIVS